MYLITGLIKFCNCSHKKLFHFTQYHNISSYDLTENENLLNPFTLLLEESNLLFYEGIHLISIRQAFHKIQTSHTNTLISTVIAGIILMCSHNDFIRGWDCGKYSFSTASVTNLCPYKNYFGGSSINVTLLMVKHDDGPMNCGWLFVRWWTIRNAIRSVLQQK